MKMPETKSMLLNELHSWQNIVKSDEWIVFRRLLKDHIDFLQKEANSYLRKHEDRQAAESLRAMDDCSQMLNLVTTRINQLNKLEKDGE